MPGTCFVTSVSRSALRGYRGGLDHCEHMTEAELPPQRGAHLPMRAPGRGAGDDGAEDVAAVSLRSACEVAECALHRFLRALGLVDSEVREMRTHQRRIGLG